MNNEERVEMLALMKEVINPLQNEFLVIHSRLDKMDDRFDMIDDRFDMIDDRFDMIDKRFEVIDQRFEVIDQRFEVIDERFSMIDEELGKIKIKIENEIEQAISLLGEGHMILNRKLDENINLAYRVEMLEHRMA